MNMGRLYDVMTWLMYGYFEMTILYTLLVIEKVSLTPSKRGNTTVLRIDRITQVNESAVYH